MNNKFEELKRHNEALALDISKAEQLGDHDLAIKLKKELYKNKLEMLEIISFNERVKNNFSALELKQKIANMKPAVRYETGVYWLDNELHNWNNTSKGLEVGSLVLLAGQSYGGKTTLLLQILANVSSYAKTLFFNFEMGDRRINSRLQKLLKTDTQYNNFLINTASRDLDDLVMEIKLAIEDGIVFFGIDSRMKITTKENLTEYQLATKITKELSEVAIKHDVIIFLINQISESDLREKRLSFKGSGDQMYDADYAFFIIVDEETEQRTLVCKKNRADERVFTVDMPNTQPVEIVYQEVVSDEVEEEEVTMPLL